MAGSIPKTMRAVVYRGVNDLRLEEVEVPRIAQDEVLVRVAACGVCPTDIKKIHYGTQPPPRIYGHETAGTIVAAGRKVAGFKVGDRVGLHHHVPCGKCHYCLHQAFAQCETYKKTGITAGFEPAGGGYAEYVRIMPFCLPGMVKIPAKNSFLEAALLEPVNTVLKAVDALPLLKGDVAVVCGAGPIGLMFIKLLSLRGVKVIATDLLPSRLKLARRFGAWKALSAEGTSWIDTVRKSTDLRGADAAVVCVPVDAVVLQAQEAIRGGGSVMLFAHTVRGRETALDLAKICVDEKGLAGSYSSDFRLQPRVARLVFSRQFDVRPLITHTFPLEKTAEGVALAAKPTPDSLKIVIVQDEAALT
jgi:L-iditol 2-dehydrogenase